MTLLVTSHYPLHFLAVRGKLIKFLRNPHSYRDAGLPYTRLRAHMNTHGTPKHTLVKSHIGALVDCDYIKTLDLSCNALRADACCAFAQVTNRRVHPPKSICDHITCRVISKGMDAQIHLLILFAAPHTTGDNSVCR